MHALGEIPVVTYLKDRQEVNDKLDSELITAQVHRQRSVGG